MTVAGQAAVNYGYDNADRLTGITQASQSVAIHCDNANRRSTLTLPNGIKLTYGFDNTNELTGLTYTLSGNPVGNMTYGYDSDGRIINRGGTLDATNLPAALASASYDANNRLTNWGGQVLSYDADGNLTGDGTNAYTWNTRNQLIGISGGTTASFLYDALGRRESKTISSTSTNFLYDGVNLEQELNGTTPTVNYLTGENIDETFSRMDSSGTFSYLTDNLGSTLALTSSTGSISTSYSYEPYGNTTVSGGSTNTLQYTGRENDGDGLYYYRARYYSPMYSRFISSDPIGLAGGVNTYEYAINNPNTFIDPLGLNVTVSLYQAAYGFGHVGIAVNSTETVGAYENSQSVEVPLGLTVPGDIHSDAGEGTPEATITIQTTSTQDDAIQQYIYEELQKHPDYNLYTQNCATFVMNALNAGGLYAPNTFLPRDFFVDLSLHYDPTQALNYILSAPIMQTSLVWEP